MLRDGTYQHSVSIVECFFVESRYVDLVSEFTIKLYENWSRRSLAEYVNSCHVA
jgi:hypothetical protein